MRQKEAEQLYVPTLQGELLCENWKVCTGRAILAQRALETSELSCWFTLMKDSVTNTEVQNLGNCIQQKYRPPGLPKSHRELEKPKEKAELIGSVSWLSISLQYVIRHSINCALIIAITMRRGWMLLTLSSCGAISSWNQLVAYTDSFIFGKKRTNLFCA